VLGGRFRTEACGDNQAVAFHRIGLIEFVRGHDGGGRHAVLFADGGQCFTGGDAMDAPGDAMFGWISCKVATNWLPAAFGTCTV
jgi:hypothetical protein